MERCLGTKRDGSPCTVSVEPPQTYCWWHAPENAAQRKQAASKGGKRGGRGRPQVEVHDIKAQLQDLVEAVLTGEQETGRAAVANQLLNTRLRAVELERRVRETEELAARVEELERKAAIGGRQKGRHTTW